MKFSIIIPTMWFHVEQLREMLTIYNDMSSVGEIILVNNNENKTPELNFDKLRVISKGKNIYVNPSWKFGVNEAKYENIVLANDDITLRGRLDLLFENIACLLKKGVIFGVGENCYSDTKFSKIRLKQRPLLSKTNMGYGYGVFMLMKKETFLNTKIHEDFLVWYGDHILYYENTPWSFEGVEVITEMRGTTSKINLKGFKEKEKKAFQLYLRSKQ